MALLNAPLTTSGAHILDAAGQPAQLAGVNWGGAQQDETLPYGLDRLSRWDIIERIIGWGMNCVRVPFALGTFVNSNGTVKTAPAKASRLAANPDLAGMTPAQVYAQLISDITAAGLYAIVNEHLKFPGWCCSQADNNGLWYNDNWPSSTFTNCWVLVAGLFAGNPLVGYDIHNEPRPATIGGKLLTPTWGDGNPATDMRLMYQNTIGRIRTAHPGCLCFCEGLGYAADLRNAGAHPVTGPGIVYSAHDYPWFHQNADKTPQSKAAYFAANDTKWGYLATQGKAPVWVGEFGSNTDANTAAFNSGWLPNFLAYYQARPLAGACWWELSATNVLGTEPATNLVKMQPGGREGFGLMAGQDWLGSQTGALAALAAILG